jgi:nitrate reductase alpha subunit
MILMLAPETNGEVAVKAWEELEKPTGRHHAHLAEGAHHTKIRFRDIAAQPRKIISSRPPGRGLNPKPSATTRATPTSTN